MKSRNPAKSIDDCVRMCKMINLQRLGCDAVDLLGAVNLLSVIDLLDVVDLLDAVLSTRGEEERDRAAQFKICLEQGYKPCYWRILEELPF